MGRLLRQETVSRVRASSPLHYEIPKKGERREIGRLIKNIIFPGIYTEYADTKASIKEKKIDTGATDEELRLSRARAKPTDKGGALDGRGSYEFLDPDFEEKMEAKVKSLKPVRKPEGFIAPTPKFAKKEEKIKVLPDLAQYGARPRKPLVLYSTESSGECRAVREAMTALDLIVEIRPCPGLKGWSDTLATATIGKRTTPYLVDNNGMFKFNGPGSKDIIDHLFDAYGPGKDSAERKRFKGSGSGGGKLNKFARVDNQAMKPITLYGWEGASFVTPVKQKLDELGLAYIFVNCASGSGNRKLLTSRTKTFQVPYIEDPNTKVNMFESKEIVKYLQSTYTTSVAQY